MDLKVGEEITNFKKLWEREDSAHRPAYRIVESSIAWDRDFTQIFKKTGGINFKSTPPSLPSNVVGGSALGHGLQWLKLWVDNVTV